MSTRVGNSKKHSGKKPDYYLKGSAVRVWRLPLILLAILLLVFILWRPLTNWLLSWAYYSPPVIVQDASSQNNSAVMSESGSASNTELSPTIWYVEVEQGTLFSAVEQWGGAPHSCTNELAIPTYGLEKVCLWSDGAKSAVITFLDNQVIAKKKIGF